MLNRFYDKEATSFIKLWTEVAEKCVGRGYPLQIYLQRSSTSIGQMSFGIRIVTTWNNLPDNIARAPSVNAFKNQLDKYWEDQEILYDYKGIIKNISKKGKQTTHQVNERTR